MPTVVRVSRDSDRHQKSRHGSELDNTPPLTTDYVLASVQRGSMVDVQAVAPMRLL